MQYCWFLIKNMHYWWARHFFPKNNYQNSNKITNYTNIYIIWEYTGRIAHNKPVQILQRGFLVHVGWGMSVCIVLHFYSWSMWPKSAANPVSMQPFLILHTLFAQSDYPHMLLFVLNVYWQPCWNSWRKDKAISPYYSALSTLLLPCSYITSSELNVKPSAQ